MKILALILLILNKWQVKIVRGYRLVWNACTALFTSNNEPNVIYDSTNDTPALQFEGDVYCWLQHKCEEAHYYTTVLHCDCEPYEDTQHYKWGIIRNPYSGLCLDASGEHVTIEHFTGWDAQLWRVEPIGNGRFFIVNKKDGNVLDIEGGAEEKHKLITYERHGGVNQQWYVNFDGTIVNACPTEKLALHIRKSRFRPGKEIVVWRKHGKRNQRFKFQWL